MSSTSLPDKALIVTSRNKADLSEYHDYYTIGVEYGCIDLYEKGIKIDYACSDFDTVSKDDYKIVEENCKKLLRLPRVKDYLDGEIAIRHAIELGIKDILLVGNGNRLDMILAVVGLVYKYNIKYLNDYNYCYLLKDGLNILEYKNGYKYFSLISLDDSIVDVNNVLYNVEDYKMTVLSPNAISNQFVNGQNGIINVKSGHVIIVYSRD